MLKTNSKQALENTKKYIIEHFTDPDDLGYEEFTSYDINNFSDVAQIIWKVSKMESYYKNGNEEDNFADWCAGLPSILDTCYYYNRSAVEDLGDILEETEAERLKFSEDAAEKMLTHMIYKTIKKAINK